MLALVLGVTATTIAPKNVVILFGDDWGYGDLGANHPDGEGLTPNLDRLAGNGLRFTDFHVGASVCTPSRAALLTGRLGLRTGVTHNFGPGSLYGLPRSEKTLAELVKPLGWRTHMTGKWHLGVADGYHPIDRGFDSYVGVPYSIDMGCAAQPQIVVGPYISASFSDCPQCSPNPQCPADTSCGRSNGCADVTLGLPLFHNRSIVQQPLDLDGLSEHYIAHTAMFLEDAVASGDRFLLYYAFSHVHVPQNTAPQWRNNTRGPFGAALREMDNEVGALVGTLKDLGALDDTLILVTGDNGPWQCKCNLSGSAGQFLGTWQKRNGGGSTGKMTVWEGGHRTVGLAHWPRGIQTAVSAALLSSLDFFPTLARIAGVDLPNDRDYDGIDLAPVFSNAKFVGHNTLFHPLSGACGSGPIGAARLGRHKAMLVTGGARACTPPGETEHNAPCSHRFQDPLLFDLSVDPAEAQPITNSSLKAEFLALIAEKHANINSTFRSVANYAKDNSGWIPAVCCNASNYACACA